MAGQNKFASLARIGGRIGGRNPVLDTAKKQLKATQQIQQTSAATAAAMSVVAGTKG
jgi:hypothetical protein